MARRPLLAGNWKMHGTVAETRSLIAALRSAIEPTEERDVVVAPPFTALATAADALAGSPIRLGAQNVHWEAKGAFTGEISAAMLAEIGCRAVIVGHSERRQLFGETDEGVNRRTRAALAAGLLPIVCVGETLEERERGATLEVVERQLRGALLDLGAAAIAGVCIAYEPVWAIGTGRTATPAQAEEVHASIRGILASVADRKTAESVRILYGGSVKPDNVDDLMREPDIDGALVGGASLDAASFARIVAFRA
jgi:triosephosphate isomerase (TIM)